MHASGSTLRRLPAAAAVALVANLCACGCTLAAKPKGWKDTVIDVLSKVTLSAEHGALFYAFDALACPGQTVDLTARLLSVKEHEPLDGAEIEFLKADRPVGRAVTDEDGYARVSWKVPKVGDYVFTAKVVKVPRSKYKPMLQCPPASLLVAARKRKTKFIVIDLDHTVVASGFFRVLFGGAKPMPDAATTIRELAKKHGIIYLTHRPDLLMVKSKNWLEAHNFPRAPLLVSKLRQAFGDSGKFKTTRIKALRKRFPYIRVGIGDKLSDAQAYVANGLRAYLIPHYDPDDPKEMEKMAGEILRLDNRVQVVDGWKDIRAGILRGKRFPPKAYARRLRQRAKQLRQQRKDDDDD